MPHFRSMTQLAKRTTPELIAALREARDRSLDLMTDLSEEQIMGPRLAIVNPMRWEIGHVAWFQEYWVLRHFLGQEPLLQDEDYLYHSATISHDFRWEVELPDRPRPIKH